VPIEVKAFALNRSELKTRLGYADPDVTLPYCGTRTVAS
jgi:hypothetical protein